MFTFARPESMLSGLVVVYGIIAIALGIEDIVVYVRLSRFTGFGPMLSLIAGILSVMCGIMLMANPNAGIWVLTVLLPVWFLAHCISGLTRLGFVRLMGSPFYYWFLLVLDITGIVLSFMMLFNPAVYSKRAKEFRKIQVFNTLIAENRVDYHFQPIVNAHTGAIFGYEALMRPQEIDGIKLSPLAPANRRIFLLQACGSRRHRFLSLKR